MSWKYLKKTSKYAAGFFACCAFLSTATFAQQEQMQAQRGLSEALGGRIRLKTDMLADGTEPKVEITTNSEGDSAIIASGELHLISDKLDLQSEYLHYSKNSGLLNAEHDVILNTEGVYAESGSLVYNLANQGLKLEKNPFVKQESGGNRILFSKMETFTVEPKGTNQLIELIGKIVEMKIEPLENGDGATEAPAGGLSAFGNNIKITARERGDQIANIKSVILADGTTEKIEMFGSVVLLSDEFNIRGNELIYDPVNQLFTAKGEVFLKQEQLTVDCGMMVYNLGSKKVRFSDNPDVMFKEGPDTTHLSDYEAVTFIIGDEVSDMQTEGVGIVDMFRTSDLENNL